VIATDAYFPNDQTSNGEAKGIEDEGKINMMKARSNNRAANRGYRGSAIENSQTEMFPVANSTLRKGELP
jgi:hypothetical protein